MSLRESANGLSMQNAHASAAIPIRLLGAASLMIAQLMSSTAKAQSSDCNPSEHKRITQAVDPFTTEMRRFVRQLESDVFSERREAKQKLELMLNKQIDVEGHLSSELEELFQAFRQEYDGNDQAEYMQHIQWRLDDIKEKMPSRITCPKGTYADLHKRLEQKLGIPIIVPTSVEMRMDAHYLGTKDEVALSCLKEFCDHIGCVPQFTQNGIELSVSDGPYQVLVTDKLCLVGGANSNAVIFYAPEKGLILDLDHQLNIGPSPYVYLQIFLFGAPMHLGKNQCEDNCEFAPELYYPSAKITALVARDPQESTLVAENFQTTHIGMQTISIASIQENDCHQWKSELRVTMEHIEHDKIIRPGWDVLTHVLQHLVEGNMYRVFDEYGKEIPAAVQMKSLGSNSYVIELDSTVRPGRIDIRGYSRLENEILPLPMRKP